MAANETGVVQGADGVTRCRWGDADEDYRHYHDHEWGRPVADDRLLFEMLVLEGFQSGLSWLTILRKRQSFRKAFRSFEVESIARFTERTVQRLLADEGIVRHRGKIEATINNARRCPAVVDEFGSLAGYVWSFEPDSSARPKRVTWTYVAEHTTSPEAVALSKDLKRRGWSFVGPTTVYSFMQAVGIVNDHVSRCHVRDAVEAARAAFLRPG